MLANNINFEVFFGQLANAIFFWKKNCIAGREWAWPSMGPGRQRAMGPGRQAPKGYSYLQMLHDIHHCCTMLLRIVNQRNFLRKYPPPLRKYPPLFRGHLRSWIEKILGIPTAVSLWKWSFSKENQFRTLPECQNFSPAARYWCIFDEKLL